MLALSHYAYLILNVSAKHCCINIPCIENQNHKRENILKIFIFHILWYLTANVDIMNTGQLQ